MKKQTAIKLVIACGLLVLAGALLYRSGAPEGDANALAPEVRQAVEQANRESGGEAARGEAGAEASAPAFMPSARPTEPGGR